MDPHASFRFGSVLISDGDKKDPGQLRSILVRNLPSRLSSDQSKEALRQLFSGSVMRANHLQANHREGQKSQEGILLVSAKQGILGQNRWPGRRLNPQEGRGDATQRKIVISNGHRKQLLQQLPYAVSNIRVATDDRGNSIYAVVDFTHEFLANLAIQLLGETATMPSTSTQVHLSLHGTWSTPLVVDQYHLYVSGLPTGITVGQVEDIITSATGMTPTHVKLSSVAGTPSRRGVQEYAFLRYSNDEIAQEALSKLMEVSVVLNLNVRRLHRHRQRGSPIEPLTHSANCSIFIANLPPLTNSEELHEICSYFHVVRAAEVHPTKNFGFVRLASHEAALAAITHLHGLKLRGWTLSCAWSTRTLNSNEEESLDDSWEREEEAYAVMSAQCMEYDGEPRQPPSVQGSGAGSVVMSPRAPAKRTATEAAGDAFWLSILAENGPLNVGELCSRMKRRQRQLQEWHEQQWEEDPAPPNVHAQVPESVAE